MAGMLEGSTRFRDVSESSPLRRGASLTMPGQGLLLRFLLVGILNTIIGMSCVFMAMWWLALDYRLANALGYAIGCCISFLFHRSWTFRYTGSWWGSFARWLGVVATAYGLNLLTAITLHQDFSIGTYAAQFGGMIVYTGTSFLGGRHFAFRPRRRTVTGHAA